MFQHLSLLTPQYVAGLFDGEGSVSISLCARVRRSGNLTHRHYLIVSIINTHRGVLDLLRKQYGGAIHRRQNGPLSRRVCWGWQIGAHKARRFLEAIQPHVLIKREQVGIALEFQGLLDARLEKYGTKRWSGSCKWTAGTQLPQDEIEKREGLRNRLRAVNGGAP